MNEKYFNELKEEGYKYIESKIDEYPILELSHISEILYVEGLMYKNIIKDKIYLFGTRYEKCSINNEGYIEIKVHENAVFEVNINKSNEVQKRIENGYIPKVTDIFNNLIDLGTSIYIKTAGKFTESFYCEDIFATLENEYRHLLPK